MANEQKTADTKLERQSKSTSIAVNIIALVLVIALSFAAGFAVAKISGEKNNRDGRPDLEEMRQNKGQRFMEGPGRSNRDRNKPNNQNENDKTDPSSKS